MNHEEGIAPYQATISIHHEASRVGTLRNRVQTGSKIRFAAVIFAAAAGLETGPRQSLRARW